MRYFTPMILLLQFSFQLSQHWHPYLFVYITCHLSFMDFFGSVPHCPISGKVYDQ